MKTTFAIAALALAFAAPAFAQTAPAPAPSLFVELGVITLDQLKQAQQEIEALRASLAAL